VGVEMTKAQKKIREMKRAAIRAGRPWPPRDRKMLKLLKLS
jgi:hypothetical protein